MNVVVDHDSEEALRSLFDVGLGLLMSPRAYMRVVLTLRSRRDTGYNWILTI